MTTVSVITVTFNEASDIEKTLGSIINQTIPVEIIVVDGGSTDGTIEIISSYLNNISHFISEPDHGIFDAMNKGIQWSRGDWIIFMNAGDRFLRASTLQEMLLDVPCHAKVIYGNKLTERGVRVRPYPLSVIQSGIIPFCHQAAMFSRNLGSSLLRFDERYRIYGDFDVVARLYNRCGKVFFHYQDVDVCVSRPGGVSSFVSWRKRREKYQILRDYFGVVGIVKGLWYRLKIFRVSNV